MERAIRQLEHIKFRLEQRNETIKKLKEYANANTYARYMCKEPVKPESEPELLKNGNKQLAAGVALLLVALITYIFAQVSIRNLLAGGHFFIYTSSYLYIYGGFAGAALLIVGLVRRSHAASKNRAIVAEYEKKVAEYPALYEQYLAEFEKRKQEYPGVVKSLSAQIDRYNAELKSMEDVLPSYWYYSIDDIIILLRRGYAGSIEAACAMIDNDFDGKRWWREK